MLKCFTPCIYYHEYHYKTKPTIKPSCIFYGKEVSKIPEKEINACNHFKMFGDLTIKYNLIHNCGDN